MTHLEPRRPHQGRDLSAAVGIDGTALGDEVPCEVLVPVLRGNTLKPRNHHDSRAGGSASAAKWTTATQPDRCYTEFIWPRMTTDGMNRG